MGVRRRATADDEELLRTLYEEHASALLGFVRRLVNGDRQHAEDIVQETLLRAWRHRDVLTADRARPWLLTVARNLVISRYRARRARAAEAATALGGPEGTVKSRSFYALRALRLALDEAGMTAP